MTWTDTRGYLRMWHNGRETYVHRVVAEQKIGRPLLPSEQVHHLNGQKDDNRPENLHVVDAQAHTIQHWQEGHFDDRVRAQIKPDCECPRCGRFGRPWAKGMCKPCYHADWHEKRQAARGRQKC